MHGLPQCYLPQTATRRCDSHSGVCVCGREEEDGHCTGCYRPDCSVVSDNWTLSCSKRAMGPLAGGSLLSARFCGLIRLGVRIPAGDFANSVHTRGFARVRSMQCGIASTEQRRRSSRFGARITTTKSAGRTETSWRHREGKKSSQCYATGSAVRRRPRGADGGPGRRHVRPVDENQGSRSWDVRDGWM